MDHTELSVSDAEGQETVARLGIDLKAWADSIRAKVAVWAACRGAPVKLCSVPVGTQLSELKALKYGWFDAVQGEAYKASDLDRIGSFVERVLAAHKLPTPYVYPTVDGEIRLEWPTATHEVAVVIMPKTDRLSLFATGILVAVDYAHEMVSFDSPEAESKIGAWVGAWFTRRDSQEAQGGS